MIEKYFAEQPCGMMVTGPYSCHGQCLAWLLGGNGAGGGVKLINVTAHQSKTREKRIFSYGRKKCGVPIKIQGI